MRYFTRRSKEKFVSIISVISILGVILGVAALIVVISIMTGFDIEIKERIIGTYSHIVVVKEGGIEKSREAMDLLGSNRNVLATSPFIDEQALLESGGKIIGVLVRGLDTEKEPYVSNVKNYVDKGKLDFGKRGVILGSELLKTLRLKEGDSISLISPFNRRKKTFEIAGTFTSGRYDYDANFAFLDIREAKDLFGRSAVSGIGVRVNNEYNAHRIKKELQKIFRYPYTVKTWMDLDRNLMRALAIEKKMMFMILGLIILVACFNITSSLIMQVLEKTKDIGILRAIGAAAGDIKSIFVFLGFFIGAIGVFLGGALGILIAKNINYIADSIERFTGFEFFPNDIYYLSKIPVSIERFDVAVIAAFALVLAVLASFYPAWKASRLNPVEAIRYE